MSKNYPKLSAILKKLLFQKDMKPVDLARALDIPPPTIHRLVTGKSTRPYQSSLEPIAHYFGVTTDQLLGTEPLFPEDQTDKAKAPSAPQGFQTVPLISWESLGNNSPLIENQLAVGNVSERSFALTMPDHSMEPLFEKGCTLIFDPAVKPIDRSYVLVKIASSGISVFRQLLIDVDNKFIKSLNPDISASSMRLLSPEDEIIACLVETRSNFQRNFMNS
ncbi:MAG: repressor protein [Gammaproteobacteria bacterium]|jgi:transcriptional regulator with XRE-family HTH domain|nr:repressor protein [Gammaproteobacteria bacterium]